MKKIWIEHLLSLVFIIIVLVSLILHFNDQQKLKRSEFNQEIEKWTNLSFLNFDNPLDRAILEESLNIFDSTQTDQHADLLEKIKTYRKQQVLDTILNPQLAAPITSNKIIELLYMYGKFIFVYIITILITYYGVHTLGVYRFILHKRNLPPNTIRLIHYLKKLKITHWKSVWSDLYPVLMLLFKILIKGTLYLILFSPAYVLAYSFRTKFGTDMLFFMIILGVISNAMLITYTHKFYTFLTAESRKGYVQTAIVKNMKNVYVVGEKDGISLLNIMHWNKKFPGHILNHIYQNARVQYIPTIKEQASFLITGLIIIEMALNIQNHLCYELLQNILYSNYAVVTTIVLGIYLLVKCTEVFVDLMSLKTSKLYSN